MLTLKKITTAWLKSNGYDGLFHADTCCGCALDDLMPCDEPFPECEPDYEGEGKCECDGECINGIWRNRPARFGNELYHGNSNGNMIVKKAFAKVRSQKNSGKP